jgi:hypothetical protein
MPNLHEVTRVREDDGVQKLELSASFFNGAVIEATVS